MKKISFIALALTSGLAVFAQSEPTLKTSMARKAYFGVKAGANIANLRQENLSAPTGIDNKTSFNGGFFVNLPLGGNVALQPEIIYNGQGAKLTSTTTPPLGQPTTTITEQDLNYISLPIMLQVKATNGLFLEVGPQASYLIRAKRDANGAAGEVNNKSDFDNFDIAANGGIGWLSRVGFGINARYSHGLSNILEDGGGNNSPNNGPELKNSTFQIGLFYMFGANK